MGNEFWNGIVADHAASQIRATKTVTPDHLTYRDWRMDVDYGAPSWPLVWTGTHKDFDASYEGEEDGWVGSHPCFHAATQRDLIHEIDCWYLDEEDARSTASPGEARPTSLPVGLGTDYSEGGEA